MTRLDTDATSGNHDELRAVVRSEVRGAASHGFWREKLRRCCSCLLAVLVVLLLLVAGFAFTLAKTGLVRVPFFSNFYHAPHPERVVTPSAQSLEALVQAQVAVMLAHPSIKGATRTVTVRLPEEALTRGLQDMARSQPESAIIFDHPQVVVDDDHVEIFSYLTLRHQATTVRLVADPVLEDGLPTVHITRALLGEVRIWHRLVDFVVRNLIRTQRGGIDQSLGGAFHVDRIALHTGALEVTLTATGGSVAPPAAPKLKK